MMATTGKASTRENTTQAAAWTHPWVDASNVGNGAAPHAVALWLNRHGVEYLLRHGRAALLASMALPALEGGSTSAATPHTRLFDHDTPRLTGRALDTELARPQPTTPLLLSEEATPLGHRFILKLPLDLALFDDHFRDAPVVPGVMQIAWALKYGAMRHGPMTCRSMDAVKFRRLVRPGDRLVLDVARDAARNRLDFTVHIDGVLCSSARLHLAGEGA